jgi:hypothetical protein
MVTCNRCGAEGERDKLFAYQGENQREQMLEQRRKQGAAMLEAATINLTQAAMAEFVMDCAYY